MGNRVKGSRHMVVRQYHIIVTLPGAGTRATLSESTGLLSSDAIIIIVTAALPDHCSVTMTASYDWCMFRQQSQEMPFWSLTTQVPWRTDLEDPWSFRNMYIRPEHFGPMTS